MSNIRKCNKLVNLNLLKETEHNLIVVQLGNLKRTMCLCGHVETGNKYTCTKCGNDKYYVKQMYGRNQLHKTEAIFKETPKGYQIFNYEYEIRWNNSTNFLSLEKSKVSIFEKYENSYSAKINRYYDTNCISKIMIDNKEKLKENEITLFEIFHKYSLSDFTIGEIFTVNKNIQSIIIQNKDNNVFLSGLLSLTGTFISQISKHTSIQSYLMSVGVPKELHDIFIENFKNLKDTLIYNYNTGHSTHYYTRSFKFELPKNWSKVPDEIKNILKYYLDNGIIELKDYFKVGCLDVPLLNNKDLLSKFLKRYLMHLKGKVFDKLSEIYKLQCLNLSKTSLTIDDIDYKRFNQIQNLDYIRFVTNKTDRNINYFINDMNDNGLKALEVFAKSKGVKKQ